MGRKTGHDFENFDGKRGGKINFYRKASAGDLIKDISNIEDGHLLLRKDSKTEDHRFQLLYILAKRVEQQKKISQDQGVSVDVNGQCTLFQENMRIVPPKGPTFEKAFTRGVNKIKYVTYNRIHAAHMLKQAHDQIELLLDKSLIQDQLFEMKNCIKSLYKQQAAANKWGDKKKKIEENKGRYFDPEKDFSPEEETKIIQGLSKPGFHPSA